MRAPLFACLSAISLAIATTSIDASAQPRALGLNVHQSTDVGLDITRDASLGWVRIDLNWLDAEPAPGMLSFGLFDAIVDNALSRGLSVLAVIGYTPAWASAGDGKGDGSLNDVPVPGAYEAFVTAAVNHFQGRVTHYELWNEPNLDVFFEGTPADYNTIVLGPGAAAVHAGCPSCKVVAPGLASVGGQYDVWMDATLAANKDAIDIVSGHIYAGFPDEVTSTADNFFQKLEAHRVLTSGDLIVFEGPLSYREVMQKHGVNKPFWLTETGREAAIGDAAALEKQTRFVRHVLEAMLPRPWWTATIFYEAFDVPGAGYTWGFGVADGSQPLGYTKKPVMDLVTKAVANNATFGGEPRDCDDGLDDEGDGLIDYPADPDCSSILASSEGEPPPDGGLGGGGGGSGGSGGAASGGGGPGGSGGDGGGAKGCGCAIDDAGPESAAIALAAVALGLASARRSSRARRDQRRA